MQFGQTLLIQTQRGHGRKFVLTGCGRIKRGAFTENVRAFFPQRKGIVSVIMGCVY